MKDRILIVDDEPALRVTLGMRLKSLGYEVSEAADGEEALKKARAELPDLILLDRLLPGKSGGEVCRELKRDLWTAYIPVVMFTLLDSIEHRLEGIELGADDYLSKDADKRELEARIQMVLRRFKTGIGTSPLTKLPGNTIIEEQIQQRIDRDEAFAVGYLDLDNFKVYNDLYGFKKGDEIIIATAKAMLEAVGSSGGPSDFVGHIGGDDFVYVTSPEYIRPIAMRIMETLKVAFPTFYREDDRRRGWVVAKDRQGHERRFPLMSVSIAGLTNRRRQFDLVAEVASVAGEMKRHAKSFKGNSYVEDKRTS